MQANGSLRTIADGLPRARIAQPSAERDEQLLLEYTATGNQHAFAELVRLYERELYRYLYRRLNDAQLAEDAFQNTFLQLHRKCRQFQAGRRLRPGSTRSPATRRSIWCGEIGGTGRLVSVPRPMTPAWIPSAAGPG